MNLTLDGERRIAVLHLSDADPVSASIVNAVRQLVDAGHANPFLLTESGADASSATTYKVQRAGIAETDLLDEIAAGQAVKRVDIFTCCSGELAADHQRLLADVGAELAHELVRLAPNTATVAEHRLYLAPYSSLRPDGDFFDLAAANNLIVIPEDRQFDSTFARPMRIDDPVVFGWHSAVEALSVAGLWSTMNGFPVENLASLTTGDGSIIVRLLRSMVRCSVSDHPSIQELLGSDDTLPVSVGFQTAPNPFVFGQVIDDHIHPPEFKLRPPEHFDPRQEIGSRRLLRRILGRVRKDVLHLPQTIRKGFEHELEAAIAESAQALIGKDSWVRSVWAGSATGAETSPPLDPMAVSAEIEAHDQIPTLDREDPNAWDKAVLGILGIIDGAEIADTARQVAGSRQFVAVDQAALTPSASTETVVEAIDALDPIRDESVLVSSRLPNGNEETDPDDEAPSAPKPTDQVQDLLSLPEKMTEAIDALDPLPDESVLVSSRLPNGNEETDPDDETRSAPKPTDQAQDLLSLVTRCFRRVQAEADERFYGHLHRLRDLTSPEARERGGVTRAIQVCLLTAAALAFIAITTLTPAADQLTFDFLTADDRIRAFAVLSAVLAIPVGLLYLPSDRRRGQVFMIGLVVSVVASMAVIVVFTPEIKVPVTGHEVFRWFLAVAITACMVAAAVIGLWKTSAVSEGWRWVNRRIVAVGGIAYALAMGIIGINRSEWRIGWIEENEIRLLATILIIALVAFLASAVMVSVVRIQDEHDLDIWRAEFHWLVGKGKESNRQRKNAESLVVHWLGSAVVLLRLIRRPYGEGPDSLTTNATRPEGSDSIRKLSTVSLHLSQSGQVAFMNRARPMLSPQGWITAHYQKLTRAYLNKQIVTVGATDDLGPRPEHCAYPVTREAAASGGARGVRWPFAYDFYAGHLDAVLRESAEAELSQALLQTFLQEPQSWTTANEDDASRTLGEIFRQLLPDGPIRFPTGVLGTFAAAFGGDRTMTPYVWWPTNVALDDAVPVPPTAQTEPRGVGSSVLIQAIRVDVSNGILLHALGEGPDEQSPPFDDTPEPPDRPRQFG